MTWISRISSAIPILLLTIVSVACILPLILVISISFSDIDSIYKHGYTLFPKEFSWEAYSYILSDTMVIMKAYAVSIFITIFGTLFSLAVLCLIAYPLSRREFKFQRPVMFYVFFTMLFNGGLVPWYIVISNYYHLKDTLWVLILPYAVIPWFLILLRTFLQLFQLKLLKQHEWKAVANIAYYFRSYCQYLNRHWPQSDY